MKRTIMVCMVFVLALLFGVTGCATLKNIESSGGPRLSIGAVTIDSDGNVTTDANLQIGAVIVPIRIAGGPETIKSFKSGTDIDVKVELNADGKLVLYQYSNGAEVGSIEADIPIMELILKLLNQGESAK